METKLTGTAKELGFSPSYIEMDENQSKNFITVLLTSEKEITLKKVDDKKIPFVLQMLNKRLGAMKLPISFSEKAKLLALILSNGNPGKMIVVLIDCLTNYEGKQVDHDDICNLYPWGFYSEKSCSEYINNYLKSRKCKWSEVYISKA